MNENKRRLSSLLDGLADVVSDLYGENASTLEKLNRELAEMPEVDPALMQTPAPADPAAKRLTLSDLPDISGIVAASARPGVPAPVPAKPAPARPALPPFETLWKTADEAIDWTEALASPTPTDGMTPPEKWALYHEQADSVLRGDVAAYLTVLKAANPMADLMPYVAALDVSAASSDELRAAFAVRPDLMEAQAQTYLCGMALRIARDLFAVLPVTHVTVLAKQADKARLTVEFSRQELMKVRFAFIDPVEFVTRCGGEFAND